MVVLKFNPAPIKNSFHSSGGEGIKVKYIRSSHLDGTRANS